MVNTVEGADGNREQFAAIIRHAVDQAFTLRKESESDEATDRFNEKVDDRIDRKFDKFKLWLFGVIGVALCSMATSVIAVVWFASAVDNKLDNLSKAQSVTLPRGEFDVFRSEIYRRLEAKDKRITELERLHRKGQQ